LERVRLGIDPAEEKRDRRLASEADTFGRALEDYLAHAKTALDDEHFQGSQART
jgi:hypothetical protein